jgi:glutathionylspermidine synthase
MLRQTIAPRPNWQQTVESQGLIYHTPEGKPYWDESAFYSLSATEVDALEAATNELHSMCLNAVQHVIDRNRFNELHIPDFAAALIREAWEKEPPAIYGRFDLAFHGRDIKLLEYNADTPTALLEAAVVQWYWLQDVFPKSDQFNSIHERLIAKWKELDNYLSKPLYFAHMDNHEDDMTATYMRDTAEQAGIKTADILIDDVGWNGSAFTDVDEHPIHSCFKLYPWEWMLRDEFGPHLREVKDLVNWIEPIWKMVLSNKGILPILWELYPGHKYLLKSYFGSAREMSNYARKPLLSREGANISLTTNTGELSSPGLYGEEGYIYQELAPIPSFSGMHPVIGSWVIDGESAGIGIRESDTLITTNLSRFVPHLFEP